MVHFNTPVQFFGGRGAFQRSSPIGGAAKGMLLKIWTVWSGFVKPSILPFVVWMIGVWAWLRMAKERSKGMSLFFILLLLYRNH